MPEKLTKTLSAPPRKNLQATLVKLEFIIDKNKRMPWTLQLQQVLHIMAQESTIQSKLQSKPCIFVTQNFKRVFLKTVFSKTVVKISRELLNRY